MASGMGQPSIGIYSYELFNAFDVDAIIRVGTAGSYQKHIKLFDIMIAQSASTDSNWGDQYGIKGSYSACADYELLAAAVESAKELHRPYHAGNILSSDVFYDDDQDTWHKWQRLGVMGVEMEAYALYCNAAKLGKRALALLAVTDSFVNQAEKATADERAYGLSNMIEVAVATAEKFAK